MRVDLMPPVPHGEVVTSVRASIRDCRSMKAAVAFWCVSAQQVDSNLPKRFGGAGFLCVDIHLPTDIDCLAGLVRAGANVYLHLKHPMPQPRELKTRVPPYLLHPKFLLFDRQDDLSELWVGSHNWTARSLTGVNIESSLRLLDVPTAAVIQQAADFLEAARALCVPFSLDDIDYYKWLQGSDDEEQVWVLEVSGDPAVVAAAGKLSVYLDDGADFRNLTRVDSSIVVAVLNGQGQETLFEARIRDTGHLDRAGVAFETRVHAVQERNSRLTLTGPSIPNAARLAQVKYWATVALGERLDGRSFELRPPDRWGAPDRSVQVPIEFRSWFPKPDKPLVQVAVARDLVERQTLPAADLIRLPEGNRIIRKKGVKATRQTGELFTLQARRVQRDPQD